MSISFASVAIAMLAAADAPDAGFARFNGESSIKISRSEKMLDLEKDFTIEVWVRFQKSIDDEYFAGNYASPKSAPGTRIPYNCGWTLRKRRERDSRGRPSKSGADRLEFTFGTLQGDWTTLFYRFQPSGGEVHLAVCRNGDMLRMYVNGRPVNRMNLSRVKITKSPLPIYVGGRPDLAGRRLRGDIAAFQISSEAKYGIATFKPRRPESADDKCLVLFNFSRQKSKTEAIDLSSKRRHGSLRNVVLHLPAGAVAAKAERQDSLPAGKQLTKGESLYSRNGQYQLQMQTNGNLTLRRVSDRKLIWSMPTKGRGELLDHQTDGNLIVKNATGKPVWTTRTSTHKGTVLHVQNDGNVVLYKGKRVLWATGTKRDR